MRSYFRIFLALVYLSCIPNIYADTHETLFTATYKGRHTGIGVKITKSLIQVSENQFVLKSKAKSFVGSISEESHFLIIDSKLVPISYQYYRKILGKKSDQRLSFDWATKIASYKRSDKPHRNKDYEVSDGTLDPSLYHIKLQQQLFHNELPLSFKYAKDSGVKEIDFDFVETSTYALGKDTLDTVNIERINQKKKKHTLITLLPRLNYQIAQITHTEENGSTHTIKLTSYQANDDLLQAFYKRISKTGIASSER